MIEMLRTSAASRSSHGASLRGAAEGQLDDPPPRQRRQQPVRTGHDQPQRRQPFGMAGRQHLRDHPAHRCADDVGTFDAEVVQQALYVVRPCRRACRAPDCGGPVTIAHHPRVDRAVSALTVHLRRQPGVAVVEPDDPIALLDQLTAEPVGPHRQLRADAHDQQHGRGVGVAEVLVEQLHVAAQRRPAAGLHLTFLRRRLPRLDPVGLRPIHLRRPSARTSLRRRWIRG